MATKKPLPKSKKPTAKKAAKKVAAKPAAKKVVKKAAPAKKATMPAKRGAQTLHKNVD